MSRGIVTVSMRAITMKGEVFSACFLWPLLIRLFDRNGNYLTHFLGEPLVKNTREIDTVTGKVFTVSYSVNIRDLRDAEMAEVSIYKSQR